MVIVALVFLAVLPTSAICDTFSASFSDGDLQRLPPIFHIDPYKACRQKQQPYCKITIKLSPGSGPPSEAWRLIEYLKRSKRHYNHDELYHAVCLEKNSTDPKKALGALYTEKYRELDLKFTITSLDCNDYDDIYTTRIFDWLLLFIIAAYLALTAIVTLLHYRAKFNNKYLMVFSLIRNVKSLINTYKNPRRHNLQCIQAIRFYTTLLIIFFHTFCSFTGGYVADTQYLEDFPLNPLRHLLRNLFVFLVQTFFLISAWLLAYNSFKLFADEAPTWARAWEYFSLTFLNRYLRILPPVLVMIPLGSSVWIYNFFQGPIKDIFSDKEFERCQKNWWLNLLFINNHCNQYDMCYLISWYLSADTQLYMLSLIILMIIWRFRSCITAILLLSLSIGIIIPAVICHVYDLDIIFRVTPENSKDILRLFEFSASYTSTYSNMATYILGLILGFCFFKLEEKPVNLRFDNQLWIISMGLPLMVLVIAGFEYEGATAAVLAGVLRPIYALGIGTAILGMALWRLGGVVKRVCEWKPAMFLGNITYSTYVVHFFIIFYRTAMAQEPMPISDGILLKSFIGDAFLSFICGFFMHVLVEMPAGQLQGLLVPKFRKKAKFN